MTGEEIKKRRAELRMTKRELADALGVSRKTVARWEQGEIRMPPTPQKLLSLLDAEKRIRDLEMELFLAASKAESKFSTKRAKEMEEAIRRGNVLPVENFINLAAGRVRFRELAAKYHPDLEPSPRAREFLRDLTDLYTAFTSPGDMAVTKKALAALERLERHYEP